MALKDIYDLDIETVEVDINGSIFLVTHLDASDVEYQRIRTKLIKPYRMAVERNELPPKLNRELAIKAFVEHCLKGWRNVVVSEGDEPLTFSHEAAIALFIDMPRLFSDITVEASDMSRFRSRDNADTVKN